MSARYLEERRQTEPNKTDHGHGGKATRAAQEAKYCWRVMVADWAPTYPSFLLKRN